MDLSYHSVDPHKVLRRLGPGRKLYITHWGAVISVPQTVAVTVHKHLGQVVKLRDQLLPIGSDRQGRETVRTVSLRVYLHRFIKITDFMLQVNTRYVVCNIHTYC